MNLAATPMQRHFRSRSRRRQPRRAPRHDVRRVGMLPPRSPPAAAYTGPNPARLPPAQTRSRRHRYYQLKPPQRQTAPYVAGSRPPPPAGFVAGADQRYHHSRTPDSSPTVASEDTGANHRHGNSISTVEESLVTTAAQRRYPLDGPDEWDMPGVMKGPNRYGSPPNLLWVCALDLAHAL